MIFTISTTCMLEWRALNSSQLRTDIMSRRIHVRALLPLALLLSYPLPTSTNAHEIAGAPATVLGLEREYQADQSSLRAAFELPASTLFLDRRERLATDWLSRLERIDFAALDPRGKAEYALLRSEVQGLLEETRFAKKNFAEIAPLLPFATLIDDLETARRRWGTLGGEAAANKLSTLAGAVKQAREHLPKPGGKQVSAAIALRAARTVRELQEVLKRWYSFYDGYLPDFAWWTKKPYEDATKQLEEYAKYLREEIAHVSGKDDDPLVGEPIGAEALADGIRRQWLPYTADELIAIAEHEFAFCEQEMKKAANEMKLGDDWKSALARVKADYVPPGRQDELVARIAREATDFVKHRDLVTVPRLCEESWGLTMISPETLKTIPYAAYNGRQMMVAYASGDMPQDDKIMVMRGNNRHFTRLVIPHELIPGHHLQFYYGSRILDRPFSTPFYVEGWALYWELRLWDLGWAQTPEDRIGMLFWRMTRSARVILTLKYHLGRMTPEEMVTFLVDRVGHEKLGARSEVRRFIQAEPLYQVGYLIGGRQILALHNEMAGPGKLSERAFHDAVLTQGPMPIELLRAALMGISLPKNATPSWRFAQP
jgi:uncharacterized protein (DUF885 family)